MQYSLNCVYVTMFKYFTAMHFVPLGLQALEREEKEEQRKRRRPLPRGQGRGRRAGPAGHAAQAPAHPTFCTFYANFEAMAVFSQVATERTARYRPRPLYYSSSESDLEAGEIKRARY